jgi:hypothetical protein
MADELRALGPEVDVAIRSGIRTILGVIAEEAKSRASFSTRIPGSIRVRVSPRGLSGSVSAGGAAAPDAAPIENKGKGNVRHMVFGDTNVWTDKNSHEAFLAPALEAKTSEVEAMIDTLLESVIEEFCRE